ncbi:tyrosine-type recombinase/integrase [Collinsella intestinalis]|uniref:tyrosine-type recombinase/integrase n=1 Tax=Collinsella intestinalis TaxID=147207 RepID=UPI002672D4D2|nr:tyrosine-type recombinase/integrase [Collinsella intestinalis]
MEQFTNYLLLKGYANNTVDSYVFAAKQLITRYTTLTDRSLLEHKEWLVSSFAPKTANNRIGAVNTYLDYIGYEGLRLRGIRVQQKPYLDKVISNEQYSAICRGLKDDGDWFWYLVVRYLACTGARVSELRKFTFAHVHEGHVDIISKGQKLRRIWIPEKLQERTLELRPDGVDDAPLFPGPTGDAITQRGIALGLKRIARRYGVDPDVVYPHSFRHLFAKNFIARDPDIALLADLMGHESIETTRIYLRRTADEQRAAVDRAIDW